jgi:hypothetical protein
MNGELERPEGQPDIPDQHTVNYVFPVEVTVVGALTDEDRRALNDGMWAAFGEAFNQTA